MRKNNILARVDSKKLKEVCDLIEAGNFATTACLALGVSKATFYHWQNLGEKHREENKKTMYVDFLDAIEKASAKAEAKHVANIAKAGMGYVIKETDNHTIIQERKTGRIYKTFVKGDWKASAWLLEKLHRERWGDMNNKVELTGSLNIGGNIDLKNISDEQLEKMQSKLLEEST
jgi:hypothetical protein